MVDLYSEKEQRREGILSYDRLLHPTQYALASVKLHILFKIWHPWSRCPYHKWCNLPYINLRITSCLKSLRNTDKWCCSRLLLCYGCGWILKLLSDRNVRRSSLTDIFFHSLFNYIISSILKDSLYHVCGTMSNNAHILFTTKVAYDIKLLHMEGCEYRH